MQSDEREKKLLGFVFVDLREEKTQIERDKEEIQIEEKKNYVEKE